MSDEFLGHRKVHIDGYVCGLTDAQKIVRNVLKQINNDTNMNPYQAFEYVDKQLQLMIDKQG